MATSIIPPLSLSVPILKFFLDNWYLLLAALVSGGLLLWPTLMRGSRDGRRLSAPSGSGGADQSQPDENDVE